MLGKFEVSFEKWRLVERCHKLGMQPQGKQPDGAPCKNFAG